MTSVGLWTIGLAVIYTLALVVGNRIINNPTRNANKVGSFFVGGRTFKPWVIAAAITGLFSGSSYIAILELSYRTGVSAVWYGVAETVQVLLIAIFLVKPMRQRALITVTGMIGERFGRVAQISSGAITAITFPMYSVATTIAFASALHAFTGLDLGVSVAVTALLLLVFLTSGGMRSLAFNQIANVIMFALMTIVGIWAIAVAASNNPLAELLQEQAELLTLGNAGTQLIIAWFATFIINVPLAQAAFQLTMSARSAEDGQKGLYQAAAVGIPLILLGVVIGTLAAVLSPAEGLPLVNIAHFMQETLPPWAVGVFFVGVWAAALGWAGPCQFSGASSLGRDVIGALKKGASEADLVRYTRYSLIGLTALMVLFGLARMEQSAWWNILAWTLRNGATFAPVLAVFFWPLATRTAAVAAVLTGFSAGLGWYAAAGFSATEFFLGIHPVWIGMSANLLALVTVTLVQAPWQLSTNAGRTRVGRFFASLSVVLLAVAIFAAEQLHAIGAFGLVGLLVILTAFISIAFHTQHASPGSAEKTPDPVLEGQV
ncbi:sodium:solute symporter family protein [Micrococcoides hystricis]|uniref:Sodium:solute symporter n=1 Tax=Micrococcoides hystricis TaxID=1572761 RepID=A0ABV6PCS0_9MICC